MTEWQLIETAPPGDELIDLWSEKWRERIPDCFRRLMDDGWMDQHGNIHDEERDRLTHWMLRPEPPVTP